MITRKELQDIARLKGLTLGNTEKDYLIDLVLLSISSRTKNELVFKGGTCMYKFHKLSRFSEDLDFSATGKVDIDKMISRVIIDLGRFGIKAELHKRKELFGSVLITLRAEGPLFTGNPRTYASLGIDISLKSLVLLEPEILSYNPIYQEIPAISVLCMKREELLAEKIRALFIRQRARDLFDLNFLLQKKIRADIKLVNKKMDYYGKKFSLDKLLKKIASLKKQWKKELEGFVSELQDFEEVQKEVKGRLRGLDKTYMVRGLLR